MFNFCFLLSFLDDYACFNTKQWKFDNLATLLLLTAHSLPTFALTISFFLTRALPFFIHHPMCEVNYILWGYILYKYFSLRDRWLINCFNINCFTWHDCEAECCVAHFMKTKHVYESECFVAVAYIVSTLLFLGHHCTDQQCISSKAERCLHFLLWFWEIFCKLSGWQWWILHKKCDIQRKHSDKQRLYTVTRK